MRDQAFDEAVRSRVALHTKRSHLNSIIQALAVSEEELARATDDAWLVEQAGGVVRIVGADPGNLKITTREDLRMAELLLSDRLG